jgi:DNA polymerase III subunit delta
MLSYQALIRQFTEGKFHPFYLLFGEEKYLQEDLTRRLTESYLGEDADFGRERIAGDSVDLADLLDKISGSSLFSARCLLIVDDPPYLLPPKKAEATGGNPEVKKSSRGDDESLLLERYLENNASSPPCGIIVFRTERIDRRRRIFKFMEKRGAVVECAPLKAEALASWIQSRVAEQGKSIERAALERVMLAGEQNLHYFSNELEKYSTYLGSKEKVITVKMVELLFSGDIQGDVFKMSDAIAAGNLDTAQDLLDLLIRKREAPLLIFFMLVRHYRLLLQSHCLLDQGLSQQAFTSALAVHPYVARKMREQAGSFNRRVLEDILITLQKVDLQIKTGEAEPARALKLLLIKIDSLQRGG